MEQNIINRLKALSSDKPTKLFEHISERLSNANERQNARQTSMSVLNAMESNGLSLEDVISNVGIEKDILLSFFKGHKMLDSIAMVKLMNFVNRYTNVEYMA